MRLPFALRLFLLQAFFWTALCYGTEWVCAQVLHLGYPYNYPAVPRFLRFGDFSAYLQNFAHFHSLAFYGQERVITYPPLAVAVMRLFVPAWAQSHAHADVLLYEACILVAGVVWLLLLYRALRARGLRGAATNVFVAGVAMTAFPFWFAVHQGNIEWVVWSIATAGIFAFWAQRNRTAAVLFGLAGAMKIFPLVLLGLLLSRRKYAAVGLALVVGAVTTVVALWLLCPQIAESARQSRIAIGALNPLYLLVLRPMEAGFDHSLWCLIKRMFWTLPPADTMHRLWHGYVLLVAAAGTALYFLRIRHLPEINQVLCLTVASIFLPPVSYDYTLLHLYAPFVLVVFLAIRASRSSGSRVEPRGLVLVLSLFAFVLSAQSEIIFHGLRVAGSFKAVALGGLFVAGLFIPLHEAEQAIEEHEPAAGAVEPEPVPLA